MKFNDVKYCLKPISEQFPPDFTMLDKLVNEGMDINIYDEDVEDACDGESLLSYVLDWYGCDLDSDECEYVYEVVKHFLDLGYDVTKNHGYHGILALHGLAYSCFCDKYSFEAAKLLINAGADTQTNMYDEEYSSIYDLFNSHDGDYRGLCEEDFYAANYFYSVCRLIKYKNKGKDINDVFHPDAVIGKRITDLYIRYGFIKKVGYTGEEHETGFDKIYIDCEGYKLNISGGLSIVVDPYLEEDDERSFVKISSLYKDIIGQMIERIEYETIKISDKYSDNKTCVHIYLSNGHQILINEDYKEGPRPQRYFMYWDYE